MGVLSAFPLVVLVLAAVQHTSAAQPDDTRIVPFKVRVPNADIKDLKDRLRNSRIGHHKLDDVNDFTWGINLPTLLDFKNYWLNEYDWRKQERLINALPQFKTEIEGLKIHFVHAKPPKKANYQQVIPLLLIHGWPGNTQDFYKIIPMLTDPRTHLNNVSIDFAYEVVAPSLPGFGWSEQSHVTGYNQMKTARMFNTLMRERLNFTKYISQGGDWGFVVSSQIARLFPENLYGIHLNHICRLPFAIAPMHSASNGSAHAVSATAEVKESGYYLEHATKPDTAGIPLNDSPIGLMGYLLEKFSTPTNYNYIWLPDGGLTRRFTKDELLTSISIDWFNHVAVSTSRWYKEFYESQENQDLAAQNVTVPTAYGTPPNDIPHCFRISQADAEQTYTNLCQYTELPDGGHFLAFEQPELLARDVIAFTKKLLNNQCN